MANTNLFYTTPEKVRNYLGIKAAFSSSTKPTAATVENFIKQAEIEINRTTSRSWRNETFPLEEDYEYYDLEHTNDEGQYILQLHEDIVSFTTFGYWDGSSYVNYLTGKTEGRADDYWVDYKKGIITFVTSVDGGKKRVRLKYTYGRPLTDLDEAGGLSDSATTINVTSATNFPSQGYIRISDEEIYYDSISSNALQNCVRGVNNTTAATHTDADPIIILPPQDVEDLANMIVALKILKSNDRLSVIPEGVSSNNLTLKAQELRQSINEQFRNLATVGVV